MRTHEPITLVARANLPGLNETADAAEWRSALIRQAFSYQQAQGGGGESANHLQQSSMASSFDVAPGDAQKKQSERSIEINLALVISAVKVLPPWMRTLSEMGGPMKAHAAPFTSRRSVASFLMPASTRVFRASSGASCRHNGRMSTSSRTSRAKMTIDFPINPVLH